MLTLSVVTCMQRIAFDECQHLQLLPAFQSALRSQPNTRCEVEEAWWYEVRCIAPSRHPDAACIATCTTANIEGPPTQCCYKRG